MVTKITKGVQVSVEVFYQVDYSSPLQSEYMFAYRVTIDNHTRHDLKLQRRHWHIFDSLKDSREIEGEGVVGMQPVIPAHTNYQYVSGCNINSEIGSMRGTYELENVDTKEVFKVDIPLFQMIVPFKNN